MWANVCLTSDPVNGGEQHRYEYPYDPCIDKISSIMIAVLPTKIALPGSELGTFPIDSFAGTT